MYKFKEIQINQDIKKTYFEIQTLNSDKNMHETHKIYRLYSEDFNELNEYLVEILKLNNLIKNKTLKIENNEKIITDFHSSGYKHAYGYITDKNEYIPLFMKIGDGYIIPELDVDFIIYFDKYHKQTLIEFELISDVIQKF